MNQSQENYDRILEEMNAMDQRVAEWHADENTRDMFRERLATINNTDGYLTGNRVLDCRSIQMFDPEEWIDLFGPNEPMRPYVQRCMEYHEDETCTVPYAGELEVSLLLEENANPARPGTHRAVFIVHVKPHRQFDDGHIIEVEYGEGSSTQQAINRLFNTEVEDGRCAIVEQFTEYQILAFLADEHQMTHLLYTYFLDGFNPMQFVDERNADPADAWRLRHECVNVVNDVLHNGIDPLTANPAVPAVPNDPVVPVVPVAVHPPPPPINDFAAIYQENYAAAADYEEDEDEQDDVWNDAAAAYANAWDYAVAEYANSLNNIIYNDINHYYDFQNNDNVHNYGPESG